MNNPFKNNSLASGLLGVIIGSGGTLGTQAIIDDEEDQKVETVIPVQRGKGSNFDVVPYSENGDVVITAHGKKYHSEYCHTLNRAKKVQRVNSEDARDVGLEPCSRCQ